MRLTRVESSPLLMKITKSNESPMETGAPDANFLAFERHFEQYWAPIYRLLRAMVGDPAEAEDLALEAMYRLYRKQADTQPESNIGGWLYRVATNLGLQSIRSFRRREQYEAQAGTEIFGERAEDMPHELAAAEEERQLARRALAQMKPQQSQLLILRYSGLAYKDIATALGVSSTSIGPLLVRAEREFEKQYRRLAQEEA